VQPIHAVSTYLAHSRPTNTSKLFQCCKYPLLVARCSSPSCCCVDKMARARVLVGRTALALEWPCTEQVSGNFGHVDGCRCCFACFSARLHAIIRCAVAMILVAHACVALAGIVCSAPPSHLQTAVTKSVQSNANPSSFSKATQLCTLPPWPRPHQPHSLHVHLPAATARPSTSHQPQARPPNCPPAATFCCACCCPWPMRHSRPNAHCQRVLGHCCRPRRPSAQGHPACPPRPRKQCPCPAELHDAALLLPCAPAHCCLASTHLWS
jgi:hypothetical protein